ncbi:MAG: EF-hand domain-containing protein [Burkholderiales bacterium]|nr:EF-hand domain-containing protein [Burkholderiales bacterium]
MKLQTLPIVLALGLFGAAHAQGGGGNMPPSFEEFDADGNGYVTQQEFTARHEKRMQERAEQQRGSRYAQGAPDFATLDRDGDGRINRNEFQEHQQLRWEQRRQATPGNGQGKGMGKRKGSS